MFSLNLGTFLVFSAFLSIACVLFLAWRLRRLRRSSDWARVRLRLMTLTHRLAKIPLVHSSTTLIIQTWHHIPWRSLIELGLIAAWALWVGRTYLNSNPNWWPHGAEVGVTMPPHFPWTALPKCGLCSLWNGWINGGSPTLADVYGAVAHPLVVGSVISFGLINGAKFIVLVSLTLAGFAQWWLAKVMRLSWLPRLWVAAMAVVGGHLAGRLQLGLVIMVISIASISLLLAPTIQLVQTGSRRTAIVLGVLAGLALLAGQGYMQAALIFAWLPALLVFAIRSTTPPFPWKEFALAGLIAMLIAAILWVPIAHFWPNWDKHVDLGMGSVQPLQYLPLNLVINDYAFYDTTALNKTTVINLYLNYIGWVPVLLALVAVRCAPHVQRRLLCFFLAAFALVFVLASGLPIIVLRDTFQVFLTGIRFPTYIASAAVPLVLGLAAWGLDFLLKSDWSFFRWRRYADRWPIFNVKPMWLLMPVIAVLAIVSVYDFSKLWLGTTPVPSAADVLMTWHTPTAEWIYPPYSQGVWIPLGLNDNLKMVTVARPWQWKDRQLPDFAIEAIWNLDRPAAGPILGTFDNLAVIAHPGVEYAYVDAGDEPVPCRATAIGGDIDVDCQNDQTGTLIVQENNWAGWYATRDGEPVELADDQWLSVSAPAGQHHYEFRYRPWDVWVGAALSLAGLGLAAVLWIRAARGESSSQPHTSPSEKT